MPFTIQYSSKITNINTLTIIDGDLYVFEFSGILKKYFGEKVLWEVNTNTQHFVKKIKQDMLFSFSQFSKIVFFSSTSGDIILNLDVNIKPINTIDNLIWGSSLIREAGMFEVCSLDENGNYKLKIGTGEYAPIKINSEYVLCQNGYHQFKNFSINESFIKWQLDIRNLLESETTQLFGDLIEYEGKLYFFLSDQKDKYGIYCIDIATGKVLNHTNQIAGFMKLSGGLLYMNKAYTLTTLHPDTFEIREIDLRSVLEPQGLSLGDMMQINLMVGQLYYFVCQNGRRESATVGIINLEDNTLVWTTEIPIESGSYWVKEIQVHGNRLFVLTQVGTLHIFEREENV